MRTFILVGFLIGGGVAAPAQQPREPPGPPGVAVVKHGWSKERINWEANPPDGSSGSSDLRGRPDMQRQIDERDRAVRSRPPRPRYAFLYKATFRNGGGKAVKAVEWDYVFYDAATGEELGRRRFNSARAIPPGKARELSHLIAAPPTHRVSAYALGKRERDGLREQVVVVRVSYADGTVWRADSPGSER